MLKDKLKKIITNLDMVLLIVILIASTFYIRNISGYKNIQIIISFLMIFYIIIRFIKKNPIKLIKTKLDIFVLLLVISTTVPLIFNTYLSLSTTISAILNYITIFWVYILTTEICRKNDNNIKYIKNIIIAISVMLIFLGIENLTTNKIFPLLGVNNIVNGESRLVSLFGNPNTLASFIMISFFISLNEMVHSSSIVSKLIYGTCNSFFILGILLTYSKFVFLIFPIIILIYLLTLKSKSKSLYIIQNLVISFIMSVIYIFLFQKLLGFEYYNFILIGTIFWIILSVFFNRLELEINIYLEKINLKKFLIIFLILIWIFAIFIRIELKNKKEFIVFSKNVVADYNSKRIKDVKPNEKYTFRFDMEAEYFLDNSKKIEDMFSIKIIQRDSKSLKEITSDEYTFSDFSGIKDMEIVTTPNTSEIKLEFTSKYEYIQKSWIINNLSINDEDIILEYKHLPTKLVEKISDISLNYKTAQERFVFLKDGFKLISDNFLTGIGGEGWQFKYGEVQEYGYISNDTHSFYTQVWLEYGILGIVSILIIIVIIIKIKSKDDSKNIKYKGIRFGILALLLHVTMDSDMYFLYTKLILFVCLGVISTLNEAKVTKKNVKSYIVNFLLIVISGITILLFFKSEIYEKKLVFNNTKSEQIGMDINSEEYRDYNMKMAKLCDELIKYERYSYAINYFKTEKVKYYILGNGKNLEDVLMEYYKYILDYENKWKYDAEKIILKNKNITGIISALEKQNDPKLYKWIKRFAKINIDEFDETKKMLVITANEKHTKKEEQMEYMIFADNYNYCLKKYSEYFAEIKIKNTTQNDIIDIINDIGNIDDIKIENNKDIIIYHTHTTEAYNDGSYEETEFKKTLDANYNILSVGEVLTNSLNNMGYNVIHLRDYNDLEGITGAYDRSYDNVKNYIKAQNKDIDIIFDIHRDAIETLLNKNYIEIDSKNVAKLRFVIAIGHDGWEENLKWAIKIQKKADELYPGLFLAMYIYDRTYNQDISKHATLIEVGNDLNMVDEARNSMIYLANVIDAVIND